MSYTYNYTTHIIILNDLSKRFSNFLFRDSIVFLQYFDGSQMINNKILMITYIKYNVHKKICIGYNNDFSAKNKISNS